MDLLQRKIHTSFIGEFYKSSLKKILNNAMLERNNYKFYLLAGFCYKKLNNFEKAVIYFTKAFKKNESSFEAYYECGLCALKMKDTCLAANCFIEAIRINPNHPYAILNLAYAHEMCSEPDMAELIYSRLLETHPQFIDGYIRKAEFLMSFERYDEVILMFKDIMRQSCTDGKVYELLGNCYLKLGKISHAQRALRKAAVLTSNFSTYKSAKKSLKQIALPKNSLKLKLC